MYANIRNPTTDDLAIRDAVSLLRAGNVVAFPTETVYGLGAHGFDEHAIASVFSIKGRPADNPLIMHLSSREDIGFVARSVPPVAEKLIEAFWPGPLTLVLERSSGVPTSVTAGLDTVAVRVPDHPVAIELIRALGAPIAAPSANRSGRPSPTTAVHVAQDFGDNVPLILDGGPTLVGLESTVLDVSGRIPRLLRPGGIGIEELRAVIGEVDSQLAESAEARSPGMRHRHYAPDCRVVLVAPAEVPPAIADLQRHDRKIGVLHRTPIEDAAGVSFVLLIPGDTAEYGRAIFRAFRDAEATGVDVLLVETVPEEGIGLAIMDRLRRAAAGSAGSQSEPSKDEMERQQGRWVSLIDRTTAEIEQ